MMFAGDLSEQDGPDEGAEDEGEDVDSDDPDLGTLTPMASSRRTWTSHCMTCHSLESRSGDRR
eukprot:961734-Alexandrium_andersonii.AAC.1